MKHGKSSQIIPVVLIVIIVVVSVAAIVALTKTLFFKGSTTTQTEQKQDADVSALLDTAPDRGVRMTIRGDITSEEKFRSYQIVITPNQRVMTTYAGYLDTPIDTVQYENNVKAYTEFVYALNRAGMVVGEQFQGEDDDTRGICADGKVLEFETIQNDNSVKRLWTTTCKKSKGSLKADSTQLSSLFLEQIPTGQDLLRKINKT